MRHVNPVQMLARRSRPGPGPTRRIAATTAAVLPIGLLFLMPSVRASAQAFLDLFRVVHFTAVPVDPDRIRQLSRQGLDLGQLIGDHVEVVADPGPAQVFLSIQAAGASAGFPLP